MGIDSSVVRRAFRHTHHIQHSLPDGYSDSFLATPPEGTEDVEAWARAEVLRRRGDRGWTITVVRMSTP